METSILESIGVEIIGVMSPVSICMFLVVLLVYTLTPASPDPVQIRSAATLVYLESPSDSTAQKFEGALLNAAVFVILIAAVTFLLVVLYYYNFNNFLKNYMRFSAFFVLGSMGGAIFLSIIQHFSIPIDSITCSILLFNFTVVGVLSVFSGGIPIILRQGYMVLLGIIVAAWFSKLPEWTTWVLLVALAVYDLVAVLAPGGPLKILVELASSRDDELPALVYEARPTVSPNRGGCGSSTASALGLLVTGSSEDSGSVELQPVPRNNENRLGVVDAANVRARQTDNNRVDEESSPLVTSSAERRPMSSGGSESDYSTAEFRSLQAHLYGSQESEIVVDEEMSPLVNMRLGSEREQTGNRGSRSNGTEIPVIETRGQEEGLYAWVAANYALGSLGDDPQETTGIIELGSASVQVTFAPEDLPPVEFSRMLKIAGVTYNLYTQSMLHFGQDGAWESLLELHNSEVLTSFSSSGEGIITNPCIPRGYPLPLDSTIGFNASNEKPLASHSVGNFSACRSEVLTLLQKGKDECVHPPCNMVSSFLPKLWGKPFSPVNFYYTSEFFGLVPNASLSELELAGVHYCEGDWSKLKEGHHGIDEVDLLRYCFSSAFIVALLHDSLRIPMDYKRIGFANQAGSTAVDWTLGAFILQTVEPLELEPENLGHIVGNDTVTYLSLFAIIFLAAIAAFYVSKWRKPQLKTVYDLEKGHYIITRIPR